MEHLDSTPLSATLVAWMRSWRAGLISYDEVIDEVCTDGEHFLRLPDDPPGLNPETHSRLAAGLSRFSRTDPDSIRLVLPAPGDPRGLTGPSVFSRAALATGEAAICGETGLVPEVVNHLSGSGDEWRTIHWHAYPATPPPPVGETVAEAEHVLLAAIQGAVHALRGVPSEQLTPEFTAALADLRGRAAGPTLPPGYNDRCQRLFHRAAAVSRIVVLATSGSRPIAQTPHFDERTDLLRPLGAAARHGQMTAINAPFGPRPGQ